MRGITKAGCDMRTGNGGGWRESHWPLLRFFARGPLGEAAPLPSAPTGLCALEGRSPPPQCCFPSRPSNAQSPVGAEGSGAASPSGPRAKKRKSGQWLSLHPPPLPVLMSHPALVIPRICCCLEIRVSPRKRATWGREKKKASCQGEKPCGGPSV
uniref:Uncharacterized protein n=1 Tax=Micrurus carvalhoi TaxID=3147026 RepID=A0A2H6N966_9SAUR